jgi:hypothetical protein
MAGTGSTLPNLALSFRSRAGLCPALRRVSSLRCLPRRLTLSLRWSSTTGKIIDSDLGTV